MPRGKWATASFFYIDRAYKRLRVDNPAMTVAQAMLAVSRNHYPFAERSGQAYKGWLKAIKDYARLAQHREQHPRKEVKR
jgi:hypothetical protein